MRSRRGQSVRIYLVSKLEHFAAHPELHGISQQPKQIIDACRYDPRYKIRTERNELILIILIDHSIRNTSRQFWADVGGYLTHDTHFNQTQILCLTNCQLNILDENIVLTSVVISFVININICPKLADVVIYYVEYIIRELYILNIKNDYFILITIGRL